MNRDISDQRGSWRILPRCGERSSDRFYAEQFETIEIVFDGQRPFGGILALQECREGSGIHGDDIDQFPTRMLLNCLDMIGSLKVDCFARAATSDS